MDSEAIERSILEATAAVRENVAALQRSLVELEDYSRSVRHSSLLAACKAAYWLQGYNLQYP